MNGVYLYRCRLLVIYKIENCFIRSPHNRGPMLLIYTDPSEIDRLRKQKMYRKRQQVYEYCINIRYLAINKPMKCKQSADTLTSDN